MKAIKITADNRAELMHRYNLTEEKFVPLGYWLVTDFGDGNMDFSLLTEVNFNFHYDKGDAIQNGWIAISRKMF